MNGIIDEYLYFKARNITNYVTTVIKSLNRSFKMPNKMSDIIYDYLNEVYLGKENLDTKALSKITGLKATNDVNYFLKLVIDYGGTTRLSLKDKLICESYVFIANATMFFICMESLTNTNKFGNLSFEDACKKSYKMVGADFQHTLKSAISECDNELMKIFYTNVKKMTKFNAAMSNDHFTYESKKMDSKQAFYMVNLHFHNEELDSYDGREIDYVQCKYDGELYMSGLEMLTIDIIDALLAKEDKKFFIEVPDYIAERKSYIKMLNTVTKLYAIRKNIVFVINYGISVDYPDNVSFLIEKGYDIALMKDRPMPSNFVINDIKYLMIDYSNDDEFARILKRARNSAEIIISNKLSRKDYLICLSLGIEHFLKKR